jgi:peptide/nickel transport system permease protein
LALLVLFGVSVIIYALIRLMPSDYVDNMFQSQMQQGRFDQEDLDHMKELYGILDNSFWGVLSGYFRWLGGTLTGDFGLSFLYGQPVAQVIADNMFVSFALALVSLILEYIIAIPLGTRVAVNQYGKLDYATSVLAMLGISLPSFFLSALIIKVFAVDTGWFPIQGIADATVNWDGNPLGLFFNQLYHLVLPMLVMTILSIGGLMRYTRTSTLEVLNADYIRTARAKGASERSVVYKHAFRNTMIPLVTMMAGTLPGLFGGAMIIEEVFAIPGIGQKAYRALVAGDVPFIMGYNMFIAVLVVVGTLLADLMYAVVDPRVKLIR